MDVQQRDNHIGMNVILTDNIATELGLANGTTGIFHKLVYGESIDHENATMSKHYPIETKYVTNPIYALIEITTAKLYVNLEKLPPKFIPIPLRSKVFSVDISCTYHKREKKYIVVVSLSQLSFHDLSFIPQDAKQSSLSNGFNYPLSQPLHLQHTNAKGKHSRR